MSMGLSQEYIIDVASAHVGATSIPGLSLLVAHGDNVVATGLGVLGAGRGPAQRDSIFRIASTSKPLTASLILQLISDGHLALDDEVSTWLPELSSPRVLRSPDGPLDDTVAARRAITVRDLLTFTNGFGTTTAMFASSRPWPIFLAAEVDLSLATLGPPNPGVQPDPDTWMARLGSLPLIAQPGSRFLYNTGAAILGVLAARVTSSSFAAALNSRILTPAGMIDTGFFTRDVERLATAYRSSPEGLVVLDEAEGDYSRPPRFEDGGAGLVSTVDDLYAFSQFLRHGANGSILPELIEQMTSDQLSDAQKVDGSFGDSFFVERSWGYGVAVGRDGSWGWDGGLGSSFWIQPDLDLSVIVLTQRRWDSPDLPLVHREIRQAAIDVFT